MCDVENSFILIRVKFGAFLFSLIKMQTTEPKNELKDGVSRLWVDVSVVPRSRYNKEWGFL